MKKTEVLWIMLERKEDRKWGKGICFRLEKKKRISKSSTVELKQSKKKNA